MTPLHLAHLDHFVPSNSGQVIDDLDRILEREIGSNLFLNNFGG
jgi:hypothetical protein